MAKFTFRLQGLLSVKEKLEEQRKMEYGHALAALERERRALRQLEEEKSFNIGEVSRRMKVSIEPEVLTLYGLYIEELKRRIKKQEKRVEAAEREAEERRLILVEAMKERKMMQKLREKDLEEFVEEEKRSEQRGVDVLVSYKYARQGVEMEEDMASAAER